MANVSISLVPSPNPVEPDLVHIEVDGESTVITKEELKVQVSDQGFLIQGSDGREIVSKS